MHSLFNFIHFSLYSIYIYIYIYIWYASKYLFHIKFWSYGQLIMLKVLNNRDYNIDQNNVIMIFVIIE